MDPVPLTLSLDTLQLPWLDKCAFAAAKVVGLEYFFKVEDNKKGAACTVHLQFSASVPRDGLDAKNPNLTPLVPLDDVKRKQAAKVQVSYYGDVQFLVLRSDYEASVKNKHKVNQSVRAIFDIKAYRGKITDLASKGDTSSPVWRQIGVRMTMRGRQAGRLVHVSPWDILEGPSVVEKDPDSQTVDDVSLSVRYKFHLIRAVMAAWPTECCEAFREPAAKVAEDYEKVGWFAPLCGIVFDTPTYSMFLYVSIRSMCQCRCVYVSSWTSCEQTLTAALRP